MRPWPLVHGCMRAVTSLLIIKWTTPAVPHVHPFNVDTCYDFGTLACFGPGRRIYSRRLTQASVSNSTPTLAKHY